MAWGVVGKTPIRGVIYRARRGRVLGKVVRERSGRVVRFDSLRPRVVFDRGSVLDRGNVLDDDGRVVMSR